MQVRNNNGWPFSKIEHWPPLTCRTCAAPTPETLGSFADFLNKENVSHENKELQPWIPFCDSKCAFCYFPVNCEKNTVDSYIKALKKALTLYTKKPYVESSTFSELYVGGGSPSVLTKDQIVDVLRHCRENFTFRGDSTAKFTACTNNLSEEKIRTLATNQVDQLDIGIQTFDDSLRKILTLRDDGKNASQKLKTVRKHGLRVSIDLLYNLPSQTIEQWMNDVKQAIELDVESVDCYPLDVYPDTPLAKKIAAGELPPADDGGTELEMYVEAYSFFKENGYQPTCHNRFSRIKEDFHKPSSEVVGSGAGFFMGHIGNYLYSDVDDVKEYVATVQNGALPIAKLGALSREEQMKKAIMLMYIRVPVDREEFKTRFGKFPEEAFPEAIRTLRQKDLIETKNGNISLTEKGDPWRVNVAWEFFNSTIQ